MWPAGIDLFHVSFNPSLSIIVQPKALHHYLALDIVAKQDGVTHTKWGKQDLREKWRADGESLSIQESFILG